jgi:hypothetical protein
MRMTDAQILITAQNHYCSRCISIHPFPFKHITLQGAEGVEGLKTLPRRAKSEVRAAVGRFSPHVGRSNSDAIRDGQHNSPYNLLNSILSGDPAHKH